MSEIPFLIRLVHGTQIAAKGREFERFDSRTNRQLPEEEEAKKEKRMTNISAYIVESFVGLPTRD